MTRAEAYRQAFLNRTDEQIIEALANELTDKVATIHSLLKEIKLYENAIDKQFQRCKKLRSIIADQISEIETLKK